MVLPAYSSTSATFLRLYLLLSCLFDACTYIHVAPYYLHYRFWNNRHARSIKTVLQEEIFVKNFVHVQLLRIIQSNEQTLFGPGEQSLDNIWIFVWISVISLMTEITSSLSVLTFARELAFYPKSHPLSALFQLSCRQLRSMADNMIPDCNSN